MRVPLLRCLSFAALAALFAIGSAGHVRRAVEVERGSVAFGAQGSFWEARDDSGTMLVQDFVDAVSLRQRDRVTVTMTEDDRRSFSTIVATVRCQETANGVDVVLREVEDQGTIVRLLRRRTVVLERSGDGETVVAERLGLDQFANRLTHEVRVDLDEAGGSVSVDRGKPLAFPLPRGHGGTSISVTFGRVALDRLTVRGTDRSDGSTFEWTDEFDVLPAAKEAATVVRSALFHLLGMLVLAILFLRVLSFGAPSPRRLFHATLVLFAPACAASAMQFLGWDARLPLTWPLFALLGFFPAVFTLRRDLGPGTNRRFPIVSAGVGLVAAAAIAYEAGRYVDRFYETMRDRERLAIELTPPPPVAMSEPAVLDAGTSFTAAGPWRDFRLTMRVVASPDAVVQVRTRGSGPSVAEGISLMLSPDEQWDGGFYEEAATSFGPLGSRARSLPERTPVEIGVDVRGRSFAGSVDGRLVAEATTRHCPRGDVSVLAVRGRVELSRLEIVAIASADAAPSPWVDRLRGALFAILVIVAYACLGPRVAAGAWVRWAAAMGLAAAPAALALRSLEPAAPELLAIAVSLVGAAILALLAPLAHGRSAAWPTRLASGILVVAAAFVTIRELRAPPWPFDSVSGRELRMTDWSVARLTMGLEHVQHPALRRWNRYLVGHELRERVHHVAKEAGTTRVLFLGTSSTFGYRADVPYGFRVERRLREAGHDVECMIGAYSGSTGARQYFQLRNVLLQFEPDVVCLSLGWNDTFALSLVDELAYLEEVSAPGYERSWFADRRLDVETARRSQRIGNLSEAIESGGDERPIPDEFASAPARFERVLEAFARLGESHGYRLILVKEPYFQPRPHLFTARFHAMMDEVGQRHGLTVVDPKPALAARGGRKLYLDAVHPKDSGHEAMAAALFPYVRAAVEAVAASH